MNYSKTVVEDFSKKIEKVYINVCKTYGLEIKKECKNYFKEIIDCDETDDCCIINSYLNGVRDVYYPYLVRYIKIINPYLYREIRDKIIRTCSVREKEKPYITLCGGILVSDERYSDILKGWNESLEKLKGGEGF